jgi:hypothetical protein
MPRPNEAAWMVDDTWVRGGHEYRLYIMGIPKQGQTGTVAGGRLIAREVLKAVQYTAPSA